MRRHRRDERETGPLAPGSVVWVNLNITVGREQAGRRRAVIVASSGYLDAVSELASRFPRRPPTAAGHGVQLTGSTLNTLPRPTFAMTEQTRTISRRRIASVAGNVDRACLASIRRWVHDLPTRRIFVTVTNIVLAHDVGPQSRACHLRDAGHGLLTDGPLGCELRPWTMTSA
jgi:mRNA interferase MazF